MRSHLFTITLLVILTNSLIVSCGSSSSEDETNGQDVIVTPPKAQQLVPINKAEQVSFADSDSTQGEISGEINIVRAVNESDVVGYRIRWGNADYCNLTAEDAIAELEATGGDLSFTVTENTMIPSDAASILVYTYNETGEMPDCDNANHTLVDLFTADEPPIPRAANQIKVMSYNVGFASAPSTATKERLIELITDTNPDIIGFQELGSVHRTDIEQGLSNDYDFYFGNDTFNSNPIALKKDLFTLLEQGSIALSVDNCTANYLISYIRLQNVAGVEFMIFNDHFCPANPKHHAQAFINEAKKLYPNLAKIFTGDLNASTNSEVMDYLLKQGDLDGQTSGLVFYDTWGLQESGITKSAAGAPIDWILISDPHQMKVVMKSVIDDQQLSDHDPVTTTLEFIMDERNLFHNPDILAGNMIDGKRVYDLTMQNGQTQFLAGKFTDTMGYNGSFFGPTLLMHKNEEVVLNVTNNLVKITDNNRALTSTTHWHGFHIPPTMDGGPHQIIAPNTTWSPTFTVLNRAGFYWYHPHIMPAGGGDRTSGTSWQVWQGLAGQIIIEDDISESLMLPKTLGIDDIPLTIQDRQFDENGQFREPPFEDLGYVWTMRKGTSVLVNGVVTPLLQSHAQIIRLRLHNGSNARTFNFGFSDNRTFYQIATDGGFLEKPVAMSRLILGNAERAEILIDLSQDLGQELVLRSFAAELGTVYVPDGLHDEHDRENYDVLTIAVGEQTENAVMSMPENQLVTHDVPLLSTAVNSDNPRVFNMNGLNMEINDKKMDMNRIDETINLGDTEVWQISNSSEFREQAHPFHIHGNSFYILSREYQGEVTLPPENERGWKDVVLVRPGEKVNIIKQFLDFADSDIPYMYHCHILKHEDSGMMGQWLVVDPDTGLN